MWPELPLLEPPLRELPLAELLRQAARPQQEEQTLREQQPRPGALLQPEALIRQAPLLGLEERPQLEELLQRVLLQEERLLPAGLVQARKLRCQEQSCRQPLPPRWCRLYFV